MHMVYVCQDTQRDNIYAIACYPHLQVNVNERDYQRKKNKFLPKIHAWYVYAVDEFWVLHIFLYHIITATICCSNSSVVADICKYDGIKPIRKF